MVEDPVRDDGVEARVVLELLELDPAEDGAFGRDRVDRGDGVAGGVQGPGEPPFPAAHFEHLRGGRREIG